MSPTGTLRYAAKRGRLLRVSGGFFDFKRLLPLALRRPLSLRGANVRRNVSPCQHAFVQCCRHFEMYYRRGFPGSLEGAPMLLPTDNTVLSAHKITCAGPSRSE